MHASIPGGAPHVLDQHRIVYNQPIVLNERLAGVAIEGVIRHNDARDDGGFLRLSVERMGTRAPAWRSRSCGAMPSKGPC